MLRKSEPEEILLDLSTLPPEKVTEVRDFIFFLKGRYGYERSVDESDAWTRKIYVTSPSRY